MIALPLLGDQFDNAQRLRETGLGDTVQPYEFTKQEMINKIDSLLNNVVLQKRLQMAAQRIQSTNRHEALALKIEQLLE